MGFLYIFGTGKPPYKLGMAKAIDTREWTLRHNKDEQWRPHDCSTASMLFKRNVDDTAKAEKELHSRFASKRCHKRAEWSDVEFKEAVAAINEIADAYGEGEEEGTLTFRIAGDLLCVLDDLRRKEEDIPTRAEMIRRLIARAGK